MYKYYLHYAHSEKICYIGMTQQYNSISSKNSQLLHQLSYLSTYKPRIYIGRYLQKTKSEFQINL